MPLRPGAGVLIVAVALCGTEIRLSRGDVRRSGPVPPVLWEHWEQDVPPRPASAVGSNPIVCSMVVSIDGRSNYALTDPARGVRFDADGDGDLDRVAWTERGADVAFLALDRDGDGRITSGRELIGSRIFEDAANGPQALLRLSSSPGQLGSLGARDPAFATLLLWRDVNHNGVSDAGELRRANLELSRIGLGFEPLRRVDGHGNRSRFRGWIFMRLGMPADDDETMKSPELDRVRQRYFYEVCLAAQ